jgi:hypothetical protein
MPGSLCFGPAGNLLRVLGDCAERLYRFWGRVVQRMRASGRYLLNPRLVRIKFKPLLAESNRVHPKGSYFTARMSAISADHDNINRCTP